MSNFDVKQIPDSNQITIKGISCFTNGEVNSHIYPMKQYKIHQTLLNNNLASYITVNNNTYIANNLWPGAFSASTRVSNMFNNTSFQLNNATSFENVHAFAFNLCASFFFLLCQVFVDTHPSSDSTANSIMSDYWVNPSSSILFTNIGLYKTWLDTVINSINQGDHNQAQTVANAVSSATQANLPIIIYDFVNAFGYTAPTPEGMFIDIMITQFNNWFIGTINIMVSDCLPVIL